MTSTPKPPRSDDARPDRGDDRRVFVPGLQGQPPSYAGVVDRRVWPVDRRSLGEGGPTGLERRRGPGRRLSDFTKAAEEGELTREQFLFLMAIEQFKKSNGKAFPTWTDVLEVIRLLGYRKTMPMELQLTSAEDWREGPDAPSQVRPDSWSRRRAVDESRRKGEAA
jgi:hypothetical protein